MSHKHCMALAPCSTNQHLYDVRMRLRWRQAPPIMIWQVCVQSDCKQTN